MCQSCNSHSASSPSQRAPCPCWVCRGPQHSCLNPSPCSQPGSGLCLRLNPNRSFPESHLHTDAAGIRFTAWVWSWFLSPRAKRCHTVTTRAQLLLHPASGPAGHEGSTGGKGRAWPSCAVLPQHIPDVCEQPCWVGGKVTLVWSPRCPWFSWMSALLCLWCVGAGMVQQQLLGSFPRSALSVLLLHHVLGPLQTPVPRFSFSVGRGGKEQPVPSRAHGSCLHQHH